MISEQFDQIWDVASGMFRSKHEEMLDTCNSSVIASIVILKRKLMNNIQDDNPHLQKAPLVGRPGFSYRW
jgi:hypothetical protein